MDKVSVIVPMYNAEKFIKDTLNSITMQSYDNIEILCVDDLSTDNTVKIVKDYIKRDSRIKLFILSEKGGASVARNHAIRQSQGKYIAFLDADDVWLEDKLEKQINFMIENDLAFTYTYFGFINENNEILETYRTSPKSVTYRTLVYGNTIGCLTVVYNQEKTGLIQIEKIDKRNDFALWLKLLKKVEKGFLFPEILSNYRFVDTSLSRKDGKLDLIKYHIDLHKRIEGNNVFKALYYTLFNMINTYTISKKYTKRR